MSKLAGYLGPFIAESGVIRAADGRTVIAAREQDADLAREIAAVLNRPPSRTFWVLERAGKYGPEYWDGGHSEQYGDIQHAAKFFDKESVFWIVRPLIDRRFAGVDGEPPRLVEHAYLDGLATAPEAA